MLPETEIIPYHLSSPPGERVLVLAPHPDDETFGCGGAVSLLLDAGKEVKVVFLTSGDRADPADPRSQASRGQRKHITDYSLMREEEAVCALRILGVTDYRFLRFPDRGLEEAYHEVLGRILGIVDAFGPDTLYCPSMIELNPDHRTAASLSMDVQKDRSKKNLDLRIAFYEVTTPLRPNVLVDVTAAYRRKKKAMECYGSQLKLVDYAGHVAAMNTIRRLTVKGPQQVEAFWLVERPFGTDDVARWLSYR